MLYIGNILRSYEYPHKCKGERAEDKEGTREKREDVFSFRFGRVEKYGKKEKNVLCKDVPHSPCPFYFKINSGNCSPTD
jgi:hypothetical protein